MRFAAHHIFILGIAALLPVSTAFATNPLIMDQFTADPTARVFEGKVYVYPSHDIKAPPGYKGKPDWFVMEDYHVFSSENLTDWEDHGVIVTQTAVEWVDPTAYAMWAPDAVFRNGKYYFYFPAIAKEGGFRIGVAIADKPYGPFKPMPTPIAGVKGIDPSVLIDSDGSAYLFYSAQKIFVAKLNPDMLSIDGEPRVVDNLPTQGLLEGPFAFKRNGIYYLTYPHVANRIERLEYATSTSALGPYQQAGVILDESQSGCWTVHHSIVDYQGQSYLFYHDRDLSPGFDKNRSIRADRLFFNTDGTIRKVIPSLRGIGLVNATSEIQIDRYSTTSPTGISISFLDEANPHAGWKTTFSTAKSWVRFNEVDFGQRALTSVEVRARTTGKGTLEIRLDAQDGPLLGRINIGQGTDWAVTSVAAKNIPTGVHDLLVTRTGDATLEVDWVRFR